MDYQIIVARYSENIDWLDKIDEKFVKTIYNKGLALNVSNEIKLENIGREAHTYLKHIIENYNNLATLTVFSQGNPFCHCRNFIERVNKIELKNNTFEWLTHNLLESDPFGKPSHHIPVDIKAFLSVTNKNINVPSQFTFGPGAQFAVSKNLILQHSLEFYQTLIEQFKEEIYCSNLSYKQDDLNYFSDRGNNFNYYYHFACLLERAWGLIFKQ